MGTKLDTTISPSAAKATSFPTVASGSGTQPRHASRASAPVPVRSKSSIASRSGRCPTTATRVTPGNSVGTAVIPCGENVSARGDVVHPGSPTGERPAPAPRSPATSAAGNSRRGTGGPSSGTAASAPPPLPRMARISLTRTTPAAGTASTSSGFSKPQIVPSSPGRGSGSQASRG